MVNDKWIIRWREFLSYSYAYGSTIEFLEGNRVSYKNELMPPGTVIHTWYSKTNFQSQRIEPMLPLIDGESAYKITTNIECDEDDRKGVILRVVFIDRYDAEFESIIIRGGNGMFKPPITTYSFRIELINGGCKEFVFDSLILQEVSEEDFDADRKRKEKNKKYRKKNKGRRKKNSDSER